jgi:hypothetical protein
MRIQRATSTFSIKTMAAAEAPYCFVTDRASAARIAFLRDAYETLRGVNVAASNGFNSIRRGAMAGSSPIDHLGKPRPPPAPRLFLLSDA